jgi:hypothetical protein
MKCFLYPPRRLSPPPLKRGILKTQHFSKQILIPKREEVKEI